MTLHAWKNINFCKGKQRKIVKKANYMESSRKGYNGDGIWYFLAHSNLFCWTVLLKPFQMFNLIMFSLILVGNFRLESKKKQWDNILKHICMGWLYSQDWYALIPAMLHICLRQKQYFTCKHRSVVHIHNHNDNAPITICRSSYL